MFPGGLVTLFDEIRDYKSHTRRDSSAHAENALGIMKASIRRRTVVAQRDHPSGDDYKRLLNTRVSLPSPIRPSRCLAT